jgi:hypothetical protein
MGLCQTKTCIQSAPASDAALRFIGRIPTLRFARENGPRYRRHNLDPKWHEAREGRDAYANIETLYGLDQSAGADHRLIALNDAPRGARRPADDLLPPQGQAVLADSGFATANGG